MNRPQHTQLPEASQLIAFERIQIVTLHGTSVLAVSGRKPYANMEVRLEPRVYVQQPEYWAIEVIGQLPGGIGLPVVTPYTVSLPLTGIIGTKGIEVVGADRSERRDLRPRTQSNVPPVDLAGTREQPVATHALLTTRRTECDAGQQASSEIVALAGCARLERVDQ